MEAVVTETFEQFYAKLEVLFECAFGRPASSAGWAWKSIFEQEAPTAQDAFEEYCDTIL